MTALAVVLSGASTQELSCQLLEAAERGHVREGQLVVVRRGAGAPPILSRVEAIRPFNDFFTEGDPWSEARRKSIAIPSNVARQYEIADLDLLRELGGGDVRFPPQPGDLVEHIDPVLDYDSIFELSGRAGIVSLGSLSGYEDLPIPLTVESIPMHLGVFGVTGSGKSYTTGALIERLLDIPTDRDAKVAYPMIVIDANGDYSNYARKTGSVPPNWRCGFIDRLVFPRALHSAKSFNGESLRPIGVSLDALTPREVAELILLYYRGTSTDLSELQLAALEGLIEVFREEKHIPTDDILTQPAKYREFVGRLDQLDNEQLHAGSKAAIKRALGNIRRRLIDDHMLIGAKSPITEPEFVDRITREPGVLLLDFSADGAPGVDLPTKQLVIGYLASVLLTRFTRFKTDGNQRYLMFLIEEAQNFCPSSAYPVGSHLARLKLMSIATQGRKFGLSLCLVSQRPSFVDPVVLSMCNSFLIHRLAPDDVDFVRRASGGLPESMKLRLTAMQRGEFVLAGQMSKVPFPIVGSVRKRERDIPHDTGSTNVVGDLLKNA